LRIDAAHHDYWLAMDDFSTRAEPGNSGAVPDALREMQSAVNADSSMAVYQLQLGQMQATAYVEGGSHDQSLISNAVVHLQRAIALDPRSDLAHADLARAYDLAGKHDQAAAEAAKTRVIARNHWQPALMAGEVYEDIGHNADAIDTYGQALSIDATLASSDYWQMTAFRRQNFDQIINHSAIAANACTHGAYLVDAHRAVASTSLARLGSDASDCSLLVFSRPHDLVLRVAYAKILMQQGDAAGAFEHLSYAVNRQPDFGPARTELGRWYAAKGDADAARHQWVLGGQLDEAESLLLLGESYPEGHVPSTVADRLRQVAGAGGAQQQVDLLAILYYRMKYARISPLEPMIVGDWQHAEPRLHAQIRDALLKWQPGSDPIP
jgi:tetratricopeptide (TPR) repeat protein